MRPGENTRDEILDAAAELITEQGFGATSTRQIADAVGVRQNVLYHHFTSKDEILGTLLEALVRPSLVAAHTLSQATMTDDPDIAARLYALTRFDADLLATWRWNLGVLFALPESRSPAYRPMLLARQELREHYIRFTAALTDLTGAPQINDYVFRLTESVSTMRADGDIDPDTPRRLASAALQLAGWAVPDNTEISRRADALLTE